MNTNIMISYFIIKHYDNHFFMHLLHNKHQAAAHEIEVNSIAQATASIID